MSGLYSLCSYVLMFMVFRLNLRELGPWACHMRWLVWVMASFGTTYVFFFHERSVHLSIHLVVSVFSCYIFFFFGVQAHPMILISEWNL